MNWIIENVGVAFRDDPKAIDLWTSAGAKVDGDIVSAGADWIRALCAKAPSEFTQIARNPERSVKIGGSNQVFAPIYGATFVRDLKEEQRYGDMESFTKLLMLTQMLPSLHHSGLDIVEPCDVPVSKRHLDMVYAHIRYTDKSHLRAITEMSLAQDSVDMAEIPHGKEVMDNNCVIMGNVNTISPFLVDKVVTKAMRIYCERGQGIVVVPFILSGAIGPISTSASVTQAMAEAMICCAYAHLIKEGAPFVLGNFLSSMSLKSGASTFGIPEPVMSNYAIGQMARRMELPLRCGGTLTAGLIEDVRAAYESADRLHSTMLAGANYVFHAAGWMEGGLCVSFEKLVMDADQLGSYQKLLEGLEVNDKNLALAAYEEVDPRGHFLVSAHTMRNYKNAFYEPALSDSENVRRWEEKGAKDMRTRAYDRWNALFRPIRTTTDQRSKKRGFKAFITIRKAELPDAQY